MLSGISKKYADLIGITSAALCLIHCLLVPVLLIVGSLTESLWSHWEAMDYLFIVLALLAVFNAARYATKAIAIGMWASVGFFIVGLLLHDVYAGALVVSTLSSVALAILHIINYRQTHKHSSIKPEYAKNSNY